MPMHNRSLKTVFASLTLLASPGLHAQRPTLATAVRAFVAVDSPVVYANLEESFTRLYLAGGVTSMRTGGNLNGFGDIGIKHAIDAGKKPGPWIDATAPYLEGPGLGLDQVHELTGPEDARRMVNFWADEGATSFKAYMHI